MNKFLAIVVALIALGGGGYWYWQNQWRVQNSLQIAGEEIAIRFGIPAEPYPPFASKDASGKWVGWEIDLMDAVCAEMKARCELVEVAWDGIIPALLEKKIDVIWLMWPYDDSEVRIDFTNKYYSVPAAFIGPKSKSIAIDINNPASMTGKIIGVQAGSLYDDYAHKVFGSAATVKLYETQENANADLIAGKVDVVLIDWNGFNSLMELDQGGDMEVKLRIPTDLIFSKGARGGLRKGDVALKDRLNAAIDAIRANGEYDEISKKYFDFDIYGG